MIPTDSLPASGSLGPRLWSRRQLLGAGAVLGTSALLGGCGAGTVMKAAKTKPSGSDLGAVEHVVFLMQENRSFDHYFGTYPGVRGFDDHSAQSLGAFAQDWPGGASSTLLPFHLNTLAGSAECTTDLSHAWDVQHRCWNGGLMDRFVATHVDPAVEGPVNGVLTMGYYDRFDLGFYYALADAFTICDGYHCSVMGPTDPNRLYAVSGTIDPAGAHGGPVVENLLTQFTLRWKTMPERLEAAGISWKAYNPPGARYQATNPFALLVSDNIFLAFSQYGDPGSALYNKAFRSLFPSDFARDVMTDTLPQVAWVFPPNGYDEHPPAPPALGMAFTHQVLDVLVSNAKVWAKTVVFVMHDENDGFFDHVPPPTPPSGTRGEFLAAGSLSSAGGIAGPIGLGFRVPMLVVSPFSTGGRVCTDVFDHTSQLRFLEQRFGVDVPTISPWRRQVTGDLTTSLHVAAPQTSFPSLPAIPGTADPLVSAQCTAAQENGGDDPGTPFQLPSVQQMPTQEVASRARIG